MQKILLAIDGIEIDIAALDFSCYLGRLTKSTITGIFLENVLGDERPVAAEIYTAPGSGDRNIKTQLIEKNIAFFKEACCNREINCQVHRDRGNPAKEIIEESRFADLIIISAETSFKRNQESVPTRFVTDVLKHAECPVVIAPKSFGDIEEIIFTYDGSRSAMFAIKQFGYLFPQLGKAKASLLEVVTADNPVIEQKHKVQDWLKTHYANCDCKTLSGDVTDNLFDYLLPRKNAFVVMGSYGRKNFFESFKKSRAHILLKTTDLPLFIAHA